MFFVSSASRWRQHPKRAIAEPSLDSPGATNKTESFIQSSASRSRVDVRPCTRRFFIIPDENTGTLSIISGFYHADLALLFSDSHSVMQGLLSDWQSMNVGK